MDEGLVPSLEQLAALRKQRDGEIRLHPEVTRRPLAGMADGAEERPEDLLSILDKIGLADRAQTAIHAVKRGVS